MTDVLSVGQEGRGRFLAFAYRHLLRLAYTNASRVFNARGCPILRLRSRAVAIMPDWPSGAMRELRLTNRTREASL